MREIFSKLYDEINTRNLMDNTEKMLRAELGQTFRDYHQAVSCAKSLMQQAGLEKIEVINFPADGKTVYQDKRMPIGWQATVGKLTIHKSAAPFPDPVVADYQRHSFHLIKGSVSAPASGRYARIITEAQLFSGEDAQGALVMADPLAFAWPDLLKSALDLGALGIISDHLVGRYETPDALQWANACTEGSHWHIQSEDRPFISFSVSPRTGDLIRQAASCGELVALVECDGKRVRERLPMVTGILPGRSRRELWVVSHLFEPMSNDNSSGVAASIEMARAIKQLAATKRIPQLNFTLRLVFAMEFYGFAAYAEKRGGWLGDQTIGAINTDAMPITEGAPINAYLAPPRAPFFGDYLMETLLDDYISGRTENKGALDHTRRRAQPALLLHEEGMYGDDTFMSDPTVGLPTQWILGASRFWHNSAQTMSFISPTRFRESAALIGAWLASILTIDARNISALFAIALTNARQHLLNESTESQITPERLRWRLAREEARLKSFDKVSAAPKLVRNAIATLRRDAAHLMAGLPTEKSLRKPKKSAPGDERSRWLQYTASIVPARKTRGFPYDQTKVPPETRARLPDRVVFGPMARLLANMDGSKNLRRLITETEWECRCEFDAGKIKKYINAIGLLSDHGYLATTFGQQISKPDIVRALRKLGIAAGDLVLVHSALAAFGRIAGGAETVIAAFREAIGPQGTILFPTFTLPYIYFDGICPRKKRYLPHDGADPSQICVGHIPQVFLKYPGVMNSAHATHSVAGLGPLTAQCLSEHKEDDSPAGASSPFAKLHKYKGKIVYFGASLATSTFLHHLEDTLDLPYLRKAVCRVKRAGGGLETLLIPKQLPGHRDFYNSNWRETKIFKKLLADGMPIRETPLGMDYVRTIAATDFYRFGIKALKADRRILLCDAPDCLFCRSY